MSNTGRPRFSVVVPAYNEGACLGQTLAALRAQDFEGTYEVIVVDNNSTDDTAAVAARLGARVVREPQQGVCAARQRGVEASTGEIVVSTDADTLQPTDWLRRIEANFADPAVVAVAGPCRYASPSWWARAYPVLLFGTVARLSAATGFVLYVTATNIAMRRSAFPGYDTGQTQGGDELDLLRRLRRRGRVVWDRRNVVTTSARRLRRGLLYNLFVTFLVYYLFAYAVNRLGSRTRFGMAPAVREARSATPVTRSEPPRRSLRRRPPGLLLGLLLAVGLAGAVRFIGPHSVSALQTFWSEP